MFLSNINEIRAGSRLWWQVVKQGSIACVFRASFLTQTGACLRCGCFRTAQPSLCWHAPGTQYESPSDNRSMPFHLVGTAAALQVSGISAALPVASWWGCRMRGSISRQRRCRDVPIAHGSAPARCKLPPASFLTTTK